MNIVLFGATGMIGRGVLLESLDSTEVTSVLSVGRRTIDLEHPKLQQITHSDFEDFSTVADRFSNLDACMWCLGVSSAGMDEKAYTRVTHDFTMAAARVLLEQNPEMRFCFVSGAGADSSEASRTMWARVKGKAENALMKTDFKEVIIYRPAFVKAQRGSKPRGALYQVMYAIFGVFSPIFRRLGQATSTIEMGRAMIAGAMGLSEKQILDSPDINALAARLTEAAKTS